MGENFHKLVDFRGENFRRLFTGAAKKHHTPKFCRENLHKFIASKVSRYTVWDQFTIMDVHMHVYNFLQLRKDVKLLNLGRLDYLVKLQEDCTMYFSLIPRHHTRAWEWG